MKMKNIVNIINFVRGEEPRLEMDLITPIRQNISMLTKLGLPSTFLLQYDALENPEIMELIKNTDETFEKGAWIEIVEPMVTGIGEEWHGRYSWDYHANVDFTIGYHLEQRYALVDIYMEKFKSVFGYYPRSVGSWVLDCRTLEYLKQKYNIEAACICRDQYGTDGYNFWGGYYNQGYYPSKYNMLCPAQTEDNQIPLPVFRMLGSDPIHQYDDGLMQNGIIDPNPNQKVMTLEPTSKRCGGNKEWIDWYFNENFSGECLSFGYTQAGQENSFGWDLVKEGLSYQYPLIAELAHSSKIKVEKLCDTGRWFSDTFVSTPPCSLPFLNDWSEEKYQTVWYYSKYYRINIIEQQGKLWIRDLHLFDEKYRERYYDYVETSFSSFYDTLPVIDGYRFSAKNMRAGGFFRNIDDGEILSEKICYRNIDNNSAVVEANPFTILLSENSIQIISDKEFSIDMVNCAEFTNANAMNKELLMKHENYDYSLKLSKGEFVKGNQHIKVVSEDCKICFDF